MEIHELNRIKVNSENYIKNLEDYITNFKDETKISNNYCTTLSNETYYNKLKIEVIHFIYYELIQRINIENFHINKEINEIKAFIEEVYMTIFIQSKFQISYSDHC